MNYYPRNVGDYLRKTIGLSLAQDGAYTRILDLYYSSEKPLRLPDLYDDARCRSKADREAVDYVLRKYFIETPEGYRHERCDEEIAKYADKSAKAKAAGEASGAARRSTEKERTFNGRSTDVEPTSKQETVNKKQETEEKQEPARKRATRSHKVPLPDGFGISPRVQEWADKGGHERLAERLEHFKSKARASGYQYVDWDEAFMGAIRDDWAKLRAVPAGSVARLTPVGQASAQILDRWIDGEGARDGTNGP